MSDPDDRPLPLQAHLDAVRELLAARLGLKPRALAAMEAPARRRLPRALRRDLAFLARTEAHCQNPARAHQYDPARVVAARERLERHLTRLDPARRRRARRAGFVAALLVNLLVLAVAIVALRRWLG